MKALESTLAIDILWKACYKYNFCHREYESINFQQNLPRGCGRALFPAHA